MDPTVDLPSENLLWEIVDITCMLLQQVFIYHRFVLDTCVYPYLKGLIKSWSRLCVYLMNIHIWPIIHAYYFLRSPQKDLVYKTLHNNDSSVVSMFTKWHHTCKSSQFTQYETLALHLPHTTLVFGKCWCFLVQLTEENLLLRFLKFLVKLGLRMNVTSWPSLSLDFHPSWHLLTSEVSSIPVSWHWQEIFDCTGGK